jgi:hypothetical protein
MVKPIRLKELNRQQERVRRIKDNINQSHLDQYQVMGASALDPKTAKIKELFQMFGLTR